MRHLIFLVCLIFTPSSLSYDLPSENEVRYVHKDGSELHLSIRHDGGLTIESFPSEEYPIYFPTFSISREKYLHNDPHIHGLIEEGKIIWRMNDQSLQVESAAKYILFYARYHSIINKNGCLSIPFKDRSDTRLLSCIKDRKGIKDFFRSLIIFIELHAADEGWHRASGEGLQIIKHGV